MINCKSFFQDLPEDFMNPECWRNTFRFSSIMELVRLKGVCEAFKEKVHFLFGKQEKLDIFDPWRGILYSNLCSDPSYYVPNSLHSLFAQPETIFANPELSVPFSETFCHEFFVLQTVHLGFICWSEVLGNQWRYWMLWHEPKLSQLKALF